MKFWTIALFCLFTLTASSQTTWKTYPHKNGFTLQLPDYFKEGLLVAGGTLQWYPTDIDNDISVTVEIWGEGTQASLQTSYEQELQTAEEVVYKTIKPGWYVISGYMTDGIRFICYQKSIIKNNVLYHLRIRYPENRKALFDGILGKIAASFK
ncbi:hypothetical protein [Chitinophaga nivalis]|uniref:Uncharacterized protein n=1 Tax=Chitinophaga nivalis TaxID=2991709 RepID=A0ABT3IMB9_9BACT|nr:hypothetical protein [Chitinophaga nivalis]MCW3465197.1 hypothetical protein [Chitinophaga nivalis]MCW3485111.1 hypothetical protein [Chitinophaga nivalis]